MAKPTIPYVDTIDRAQTSISELLREANAEHETMRRQRDRYYGALALIRLQPENAADIATKALQGEGPK